MDRRFAIKEAEGVYVYKDAEGNITDIEVDETEMLRAKVRELETKVSELEEELEEYLWDIAHECLFDRNSIRYFDHMHRSSYQDALDRLVELGKLTKEGSRYYKEKD
jgi:polyhydroxyalkanoate synthesis regulator phasin